MMNRRLFSGTALAAVAAGLGLVHGRAASAAGFEVTRSDAEWKAMLSALEYKVMRKEGTERAGSSPLNAEKRRGVFACRGCDLPLYASEAKYESGTGWPSFWQSLPGAVATKEDRSYFSLRTEVHCRRCGSHLGHIFDDGPKPTGKRHCLNGVSLVFVPA